MCYSSVGGGGQEHRWCIKMEDTSSLPHINLELKPKHPGYERYHHAHWEPEFTQWRSGGGAAAAKSSRPIVSQSQLPSVTFQLVFIASDN